METQGPNSPLPPLGLTALLLNPTIQACVEWLEGGSRSARRGWAGPVCVQKLPQSDFPAAEVQPSPCPCLKNFLNSIPVLFLTALKPYSVLQYSFVRPTPSYWAASSSEWETHVSSTDALPCPSARASAGLTQPQRQGLLEPMLISQPFSTWPLVWGVRCWSWVSSCCRSMPPLFNFLLPFTVPSWWPMLAPPTPQLLPVLIKSLLQLRSGNSDLILLPAIASVFAQHFNCWRGNNSFSIFRLVRHFRVVPSSWCVHLLLMSLKIMQLFFRHFCGSLLYNNAGLKM